MKKTELLNFLHTRGFGYISKDELSKIIDIVMVNAEYEAPHESGQQEHDEIMREIMGH